MGHGQAHAAALRALGGVERLARSHALAGQPPPAASSTSAATAIAPCSDVPHPTTLTGSHWPATASWIAAATSVTPAGGESSIAPDRRRLGRDHLLGDPGRALAQLGEVARGARQCQGDRGRRGARRRAAGGDRGSTASGGETAIEPISGRTSTPASRAPAATLAAAAARPRSRRRELDGGEQAEPGTDLGHGGVVGQRRERVRERPLELAPARDEVLAVVDVEHGQGGGAAGSDGRRTWRRGGARAARALEERRGDRADAITPPSGR